MPSRRGFLRGLVGAAPGALVGGVSVSKAAVAEGRTAFNFMCSCGASLVAGVPKEVGTHVKVDCDCGAKLDLEWCGDHFKTRMRGGTESANTFNPEKWEENLRAEAQKGAKELKRG